MNVSTLLLVAALTVPAESSETWTSVYKPSTEFAAAVRGQTPMYDETPFGGQPGIPSEGYAPPADPGAQWLNPFAPPQTYDPFLAPPAGVAPIGLPPMGYSFGANGPQPYRFGWTSWYDTAFLPKVPSNGGLGYGHFGVFEFNSQWRYTTPLSSGWIFSVAPQFGLRSWDGPSTGAFPGLPGSVFRIGTDLELATPVVGPWSFQFGFNPAVATDFEQQLSSDGWNLDGRAIAFYQYSPQLMLALGAGYWDRVRDRVIPYAGVVWLPDDRWEIRALFPESRVSYFLGNVDNWAKWLYVSGEYHVESYEVQLETATAAVKDQVELEDWRIMLGLRMDRGGLSMFIEGGVVLGRDVNFRGASYADFDPDTGFIGRIGLRY